MILAIAAVIAVAIGALVIGIPALALTIYQIASGESE